jgi:primosomal protein N'
VLVKSTSRKALNLVLTETLAQLRRRRRNLDKVAIDVDPVNLM